MIQGARQGKTGFPGDFHEGFLGVLFGKKQNTFVVTKKKKYFCKQQGPTAEPREGKSRAVKSHKRKEYKKECEYIRVCGCIMYLYK